MWQAPRSFLVTGMASADMLASALLSPQVPAPLEVSSAGVVAGGWHLDCSQCPQRGAHRAGCH